MHSNNGSTSRQEADRRGGLWHVLRIWWWKLKPSKDHSNTSAAGPVQDVLTTLRTAIAVLATFMRYAARSSDSVQRARADWSSASATRDLTKSNARRST